MMQKRALLLSIISIHVMHSVVPWHKQQEMQSSNIEIDASEQEIDAPKRKPKFLHITFHKGCLLEVERVAKALDVDVTPWFIFDKPLEHFEGQNAGLYVYNITEERAQRVWEKHKDYFNQFDAIITSDTAPLSRIFLQHNNWKKPLIIWVCNRFDFFYSPTHKPIDFPDEKYYRLFRDATKKENVFIVSYTPYEWYFALQRGVDMGLRTIKPIGVVEEKLRYRDPRWSIPKTVDKPNTIFVYPCRISDHEMNYIKQQCEQQGIKTYSGRYNGTSDIADFKGILYWPYQWSNLCLFEDWHRGLVHFVPSPTLLKELKQKGMPIPAVLDSMIADGTYKFSEWYTPEHKDLIVYFDSWQDLKHKIATTDYDAMSRKIKAFAHEHKCTMMSGWRDLFDEVGACCA